MQGPQPLPFNIDPTLLGRSSETPEEKNKTVEDQRKTQEEQSQKKQEEDRRREELEKLAPNLQLSNQKADAFRKDLSAGSIVDKEAVTPPTGLVVAEVTHKVADQVQVTLAGQVASAEAAARVAEQSTQIARVETSQVTEVARGLVSDAIHHNPLIAPDEKRLLEDRVLAEVLAGTQGIDEKIKRKKEEARDEQAEKAKKEKQGKGELALTF